MNKASGGDGIPVELFQSLKDNAVKVLYSICQQIWKTQQWLQDWKRSVFILIPKKGNAKECSNYCTIELISHASKVMLKILQARLQQYMNCELPDVQDGFRKARGIRDQTATIHWIIQTAREFQKNIYFCFTDYTKVFDCVDHNKLWKILSSVQFSSVAQLCPTLCNPMNRGRPGLPVHHHLPEFTQTHVHRVSDAIQPSHPGSSCSPPATNPSQHQSLFQWVSSSHEVAKVLEFQL